MVRDFAARWKHHGVFVVDEGNFVFMCLFSRCTAMDRKYLRREGFTHVLNMAEGSGTGFVNTDEHFYRNMGISYLGIRAHDMMSYSLDRYFMLAIEFMDDALGRGGEPVVR